jgi:hypothetical protein
LFRELEIPIINIRTPPSSPPGRPPTIDHSLHSPFISVQHPLSTQKGASSPSLPVLLPPSAFQITHNEIKMPLSSRRIVEDKSPIPHRPYSTQPSTNILINNKDNLLNVKQRLEIYLNNKTKLK